MTSLFGKIFGPGDGEHHPSKQATADQSYDRAMAESDDLIEHMRQASQSKDAVRAVMADIWQQHHNIPFMATVYEAVAEMKAATDQQDAV